MYRAFLQLHALLTRKVEASVMTVDWQDRFGQASLGQVLCLSQQGS